MKREAYEFITYFSVFLARTFGDWKFVDELGGVPPDAFAPLPEGEEDMEFSYCAGDIVAALAAITDMTSTAKQGPERFFEFYDSLRDLDVDSLILLLKSNIEKYEVSALDDYNCMITVEFCKQVLACSTREDMEKALVVLKYGFALFADEVPHKPRLRLA